MPRNWGKNTTLVAGLTLGGLHRISSSARGVSAALLILDVLGRQLARRSSTASGSLPLPDSPDRCGRLGYNPPCGRDLCRDL